MCGFVRAQPVHRLACKSSVPVAGTSAYSAHMYILLKLHLPDAVILGDYGGHAFGTPVRNRKI